MKSILSILVMRWMTLLGCLFAFAIVSSHLLHRFSFLVIVFFLFISLPGRALALPSLSGGGVHSLAVSSNGTLLAWGLKGTGQLGDGTTVSWLVPTQVVGESGIGYLNLLNSELDNQVPLSDQSGAAIVKQIF